MSESSSQLMEAPAEYTRLLGRLVGELPGPTVVVVAGLHGNEPAGPLAARRVFARLAEAGYPVEGAAPGAAAPSAAPAFRGPAGSPERAPVCRGEFVALTGNIGALRRKTRFIDRDLNRQWQDDRLTELEGAGPAALAAASSEDREMLELKRELDAIQARARGSVYFIDLHTTSAEGVPFSMIFREPQHQVFALKFQLPIVLGLLDSLDGVLMKYMYGRGCVVLGVEGGQNDHPTSIDHHEEVLWIALAAAGILPQSAAPDLDLDLWRLEKSRGTLPRLLEIRDRHAITPADRFEMVPGYLNIQRIERDELLAHDRNGEVRATEAGLVLMPLYQAQGEEGFFFAREVIA